MKPATVQPPVVVPSPSAVIERRRTGVPAGVTVTVTGDVGHADAAVLSRCMHAAIDGSPSMLVVDLSGVTSRAASIPEVLDEVRQRARAAGVGLHVLDADLARRQVRSDRGRSSWPSRQIAPGGHSPTDRRTGSSMPLRRPSSTSWWTQIERTGRSSDDRPHRR